jgi:DNA-binding SARP family transcriptional activator
MRAQIAYGQRTAAMMTYHVCRRVLAEELGIDPSPETTALYESLLE